MKAQRHARPATVATRYRREHGVVLIITLIMLVVMSLAGVAVVRSVDATRSVAGNLALRQASIEPANLAVENAAAALFADATKATVTILDPTANLPSTLAALLCPAARRKCSMPSSAGILHGRTGSGVTTQCTPSTMLPLPP